MGKWQTKPLECWAKFREMRADHYRDVASANEEGKILITGSIGSPFPLLDGLGDDVVFFAGEGYGASGGGDGELAPRYLGAVEQQGFARDMCSYMRIYWGAMFSNHFMFGNGPFPKPRFCFTQNRCDAGNAKWFQVVAEHYGVPMLVVDLPFGPADGRVEQRSEYIAAQMSDCIEQMEAITGRRYDDEKFIQASRNFFESETLWGEICLLNGAVPAPLDLNMFFGLMPVSTFLRNQSDCVAALRMLRDEVRYRIASEIGASENESVRIVTDFVPPWSFIKMFRMLRDRGVVFVGLWAYSVLGGYVDFPEDGTVVTGQTPDQLGWPMRTRDDVLRAWGRRIMLHPHESGAGNPHDHTRQLVSLYKHWKGDGILMSYNRGCPLQLNFRPEVKRLLENEGIPVAMYEANASDMRDTDEAQITRRLGAFAEMLEQEVAGRA